MRKARAERDFDGSSWLPEDALYDAWVQMKDEPPDCAMVVCWYHRLPNGNLALKYRVHQQHSRQGRALIADMNVDLSQDTE